MGVIIMEQEICEDNFGTLESENEDQEDQEYLKIKRSGLFADNDEESWTSYSSYDDYDYDTYSDDSYSDEYLNRRRRAGARHSDEYYDSSYLGDSTDDLYEDFSDDYSDYSDSDSHEWNLSDDFEGAKEILAFFGREDHDYGDEYIYEPSDDLYSQDNESDQYSEYSGMFIINENYIHDEVEQYVHSAYEGDESGADGTDLEDDILEITNMLERLLSETECSSDDDDEFEYCTENESADEIASQLLSAADQYPPGFAPEIVTQDAPAPAALQPSVLKPIVGTQPLLQVDDFRPQKSVPIVQTAPAPTSLQPLLQSYYCNPYYYPQYQYYASPKRPVLQAADNKPVDKYIYKPTAVKYVFHT